MSAIKKFKKQKTFKPGTVVVFDPTLFNEKYWADLPEQDRIKYYGDLGYGKDRAVCFVFLCEILHDGEPSGHCVLVNLENQKIETMRHTDEFRLATDEEL